MREGVIISGGAHVVLLVAAALGLPERVTEADTSPRLVAAEVLSLDEFNALRSAAPDVLAMETALSAPVEDSLTSPDPSEDVSPEHAAAPAPDAPKTDDAPDLSALDLTQPDVAVDLEAPQVAAPAPPGMDAPVLNAPTTEGVLHAREPSLATPAPPSLAPRIDTRAAEQPETPAKQADETQVAVAETGAGNETAQEATAPAEAVVEIVPEAVPDAPKTSPKAAARPRGRPVTLQADAEAAQETERASELAAAEVKRKEEMARQAKAAEEARRAEARRQAEEIAAAVAVAAEEARKPRLGAGFSRGEATAVGDAIGGFWNMAPLTGKVGYENLIVTVRIRLTAAGKAMGKVEPVKPINPKGDFAVAFRQAKTAVLRAASRGIPLPQDKFRDGDYLEIRFDPGVEAITLN